MTKFSTDHHGQLAMLTGLIKAPSSGFESVCIPYMHGQTNYLQASSGMLMGMHNALSTTVGLAANMYGQDSLNAYTITLRSSDDSMTLYLAREPNILDLCIEVERRSLKLLGINLSSSKTLIFKQGYGEYTSWYQDGEFISQFGVETSTIRPQGKNPMDDFYSIAKGTSISQQRLEMNPFGAAAKLTIGIDNCRRLWRVKRDPIKRENISSKVLLLADGGDRQPLDSNEVPPRRDFLKGALGNK